MKLIPCGFVVVVLLDVWQTMVMEAMKYLVLLEEATPPAFREATRG